jgi:hypothetical protein
MSTLAIILKAQYGHEHVRVNTGNQFLWDRERNNSGTQALTCTCYVRTYDYIKQIRFVFKGLIIYRTSTFLLFSDVCNIWPRKLKNHILYDLRNDNIINLLLLLLLLQFHVFFFCLRTSAAEYCNKGLGTDVTGVPT